jgi:hypothetical protein
MKVENTPHSPRSERREKRFSQADVTRIFKGAKAAGESVSVKVHPDGTIVATPLRHPDDGGSSNEWDDVK